MRVVSSEKYSWLKPPDKVLPSEKESAGIAEKVQHADAVMADGEKGVNSGGYQRHDKSRLCQRQC